MKRLHLIRQSAPIRTSNHSVAAMLTPFLFVLFLLFFLTLQAQPGVCPPSIDNMAQTCEDFDKETSAFSPPGFPSCKIKISYRYRLCYTEDNFGKKTYTYRIDDWKYAPLLGCSSWKKYLIRLNNTDPEAFKIYMQEFNKQVAHNVSDDLANALMPDFPEKLEYACNGLGNQQSKYVFEGTFYLGSCNSLCIGSRGETETVIEKTLCDNTACCFLQKKYCYDVTTGKAVAFESTVHGLNYNDPSGQISACQNEGPAGACPELIGVIWNTKTVCYPTCGNTNGTKTIPSIIPESEYNAYKLSSKTIEAYVYPNPVVDELNIIMSRIETGNFTLFTIDGRSVLESAINQSSNLKINVEQLSAGTYILQYMSKDQTVFMMEKITIQ